MKEQVQALEKAGFNQVQIDASADFMQEQTATRADMLESRGNLGERIEAARGDLGLEISTVRIGVKSKLGLLRWASGVSVALSVAIHTKLLIQGPRKWLP